MTHVQLGVLVHSQRDRVTLRRAAVSHPRIRRGRRRSVPSHRFASRALPPRLPPALVPGTVVGSEGAVVTGSRRVRQPHQRPAVDGRLLHGPSGRQRGAPIDHDRPCRPRQSLPQHHLLPSPAVGSQRPQGARQPLQQPAASCRSHQRRPAVRHRRRPRPSAPRVPGVPLDHRLVRVTLPDLRGSRVHVTVEQHEPGQATTAARHRQSQAGWRGGRGGAVTLDPATLTPSPRTSATLRPPTSLVRT